MNRSKFRLLLIALAVILCFTSAFAQSKVEGTWKGALTVSGANLRLVFNITKGTDGSLKATMDSPDQGANGIPIDIVTFKNDSLHIEMRAIGGTYDGVLVKGESRIEGNWKQGGMLLPLNLSQGDQPAAPSPATPEKSHSSDQKDLLGMWIGPLSFAGMELRVVFHIETDSTGKLTAALDSPDQGVNGIPMDSVSFSAGHLIITSKKLDGGFDADLTADKKSIFGKWSQHGMSTPLTMTKTDKVVELKRPQEPKPPFPYDTLNVTFENKAAAGVTLAGTLTTPTGNGPFPAVVLVTGSGAQDRDEALMGHKPFAVLADYLTRRGIAVLRFDDRGFGKSTGKFATATSADFCTDALAGVAWLKGNRKINPKQIGMIGHSEGGLIAPMAAVQSPDVAFIVMMAGPGTTGSRILKAQGEMIGRASGIPENLIKANSDISEEIYKIVVATADSAEAAAKIKKLVAERSASLSDTVKKALELTPEGVEASLKSLLTPWFRYFLAYDPAPTIQKVKCPVLAINGEKDVQVPGEENLKAIEAALRAGGNKDYQTKLLASLNHLFQTCETGAPSEYARIEETMSPTALAAMGDWILAHTTARK